MATCSKCGGWMEDGLTLCPACKRNQDLIDEQESITADQQNQAEEHEAEMRRIAEEQTAEQERIANESHLNEIKRKLLEIAVEGVSAPRSAAKKALVLMESPDFEGNVECFWPSVSSNSFLQDTYLTHLLSTVEESTDAEAFFDPMEASVYNDAVAWVNARGELLNNRALVSEKIDQYSETLRQREVEQRKNEAAEQSAQHLRELKRKASRGTLGLFASALFIISALPIAWHTVSLWMGAWNHGGNPKDWSVRLASAGTSSIGSTVAVWTGIALYVIGLITAIKATWGGIDESNEDNKSVHQLFAFVGSVILTVHFWGQVTDSRFHVAMVAACVILPFIPFVRICLASLGGGMAMAYVLIVPAWVVGWTSGSITGWFSTSHPVQAAPANPGNRPTENQDGTSGIINKIQAGH